MNKVVWFGDVSISNFSTGTEIPGLFIPSNGFIVCDQAYKIRSYQLQPFPDEEVGDSTGMQKYNDVVRKARRVVERVFGILKKQWKILTRACEQKTFKKTQMIWALLILYNMMTRKKQVWYEDDEMANEHLSFDVETLLRDAPDADPDVAMSDASALHAGYERRAEVALEVMRHFKLIDE